MDESDWDVHYWATEERMPPGRWTGSRLLEKLKAGARNGGSDGCRTCLYKERVYSVSLRLFLPSLGGLLEVLLSSKAPILPLYTLKILVYDTLITNPLPQPTSFHTSLAVIYRPNHLAGNFCPTDCAGAPRIHWRASNPGHRLAPASTPPVQCPLLWEAAVDPTCMPVGEG